MPCCFQMLCDAVLLATAVIKAVGKTDHATAGSTTAAFDQVYIVPFIGIYAGYPSRQLLLHFSHLKNRVAGSSADRVCTSMKYALPCPHFGQGTAAANSAVMHTPNMLCLRGIRLPVKVPKTPHKYNDITLLALSSCISSSAW